MTSLNTPRSAATWYNLVLAFSIFIFCFAPKLITLSIILLAVFTSYHVIKKQMKFHFSSIGLLFMLFYFVYVVGSLFTNHWGDALKYFEYKLVLVIFPILFSFRFSESISLRVVSSGLILGVIVASILGLIHSFGVYQQHGDFNNSFGASIFSYIHHPTYFSAFLLVASYLAYVGFRQNWKFFSGVSVGIFILFSFVMQFFCFSFAGMIFLFFTLVFFFYEFLWRKAKRIVFSIFLILFPVIPVIIYNSNIHIQIEIDEAFQDVKSYITNPKSVLANTTNVSGNNVRLVMWTVSAEEFLCHPLGAGTANVDDVLGKRLLNYNQVAIAQEKYNPHNQFLQIAVEIGIIGLLLFFVLLGALVKIAIQQRNGFLMFIVLNLVFNCLFESMLQRQSGIVFYSFWIFIAIHAAVKDSSINKFFIDSKI